MTVKRFLLWCLFVVYGSLKLLPFFDDGVVDSDANSYLHCNVGAVLNFLD